MLDISQQWNGSAPYIFWRKFDRQSIFGMKDYLQLDEENAEEISDIFPIKLGVIPIAQ